MDGSRPRTASCPPTYNQRGGQPAPYLPPGANRASIVTTTYCRVLPLAFLPAYWRISIGPSDSARCCLVLTSSPTLVPSLGATQDQRPSALPNLDINYCTHVAVGSACHRDLLVSPLRDFRGKIFQKGSLTHATLPRLIGSTAPVAGLLMSSPHRPTQDAPHVA